VAVVALLALLIIIWRWRNSAATEQNRHRVSVRVAKAERQPISAQVSAVGTIFPRDKRGCGQSQRPDQADGHPEK